MVSKANAKRMFPGEDVVVVLVLNEFFSKSRVGGLGTSMDMEANFEDVSKGL